MSVNKPPRTDRDIIKAQIAGLGKKEEEVVEEEEVPIGLRKPKEFVNSIQGSSAGAGSGEFHLYKNSRRWESERLELMEREYQDTKEREAYELKRAEMKRVDEERTEKRRRKRERVKARKGKASS